MGKLRTLKATKLKLLKSEGQSLSLTYKSSSIYLSSRAYLNPGCKASLFLFLKTGIETFSLIIGPL
jgi:hypothetical protein